MKQLIYIVVLGLMSFLGKAGINGQQKEGGQEFFNDSLPPKSDFDTLALKNPRRVSVKASKDTLKAEEKYGFKNLFINNKFISGQAYEAQLHPMAVAFVNEYMAKNGQWLKGMKKWGQPYFSMMDNILVQYGIPREMRYLSVIESSLNAGTVSWAGAVGPWQLMPDEGQRFGLIMNRYTDERTNYYKSTHVAAQLMRELYNQFGDWLLVIAAYNGGAGRMRSAIRRSGSRNFWDLQYFLPAETRNHVKKFIATHYIMEGSAGLTTTVTADLQKMNISPAVAGSGNLSEEELKFLKTQPVSGKYNSVVIAKYIMMDIAQFNHYNPGFDEQLAGPENNYTLRLPADKMDLFVAKRYEILSESVMMMLNRATPVIVPAPVKTTPKKRRGF
jgi:membrane-bound lytic murein transglycosylase D